jgi:hypothetical protein
VAGNAWYKRSRGIHRNQSEVVVQQDLGNLKETENVGIRRPSAESEPIVEEDLNDTKEEKQTGVSKEVDDGGSNFNNSTHGGRGHSSCVDMGGRKWENNPTVPMASIARKNLVEREVLQRNE